MIINSRYILLVLAFLFFVCLSTDFLQYNSQPSLVYAKPKDRKPEFEEAEDGEEDDDSEEDEDEDENGDDDDTESSDPARIGWQDTELTTHLWRIISSGDISSMKQVLSRNPEVVYVRSADGRGPLFWAYEYEQLEIVNLLSRCGSPPDIREKGGKTPLDLLPNTPRYQQQHRNPPKGPRPQYSKFRTCNLCITSGFGWDLEMAICGDFPNKQCPIDDNRSHNDDEDEDEDEDIDDDDEMEDDSK